MLPKKLQKRIEDRKEKNSFRRLGVPSTLVDFSSNDYLGFSKSNTIFTRTAEVLKAENLETNGATGSRLLSGNHPLYEIAEDKVAQFHTIESALLFNSGFDANLGFFGAVPQRGDIILYDELCHASIRDGIKMSNAKAYKFRHNDLNALIALTKKKLPSTLRGDASRQRGYGAEVYIVTESVFSMDGDSPDLVSLTQFCTSNGYHLVVDEAHALGIFGNKGEGLVQQLGLEKQVFARLVTFGKALGCHGAAILGSQDLKEYLINFARSLIYTTALSPHSVATICAAYEMLENMSAQNQLKSNIAILRNKISEYLLNDFFIESQSAIHSCIIPGNDRVKTISNLLKKDGFNVKPILSPSVPVGEERLRVCVHSFNTAAEIGDLMSAISSCTTNNSPLEGG